MVLGVFEELFKEERKEHPSFFDERNFKTFFVNSIMMVGGGSEGNKKNVMNDFFPVLPYVTLTLLPKFYS